MLSRLMARSASGNRGGRHVVGGVRLLFVLLFILASPQALRAEVMPQEARELASSGAVELALALVQREQGTDPHAAHWMEWERLRFELLKAAGHWKELAARAGELPSGVPDEFRQAAAMERIEAFLRLGRGADARKLLLPMIWTQANDRLSSLRRLVIRSYLVDGRADDAYAAMVRYRQDYSDARDDERLLIARVLLTKGRFKQVDSVLAGLKSPEGEGLSMLAKLRAGTSNPRRVLRVARKSAAAPGLSAENSEFFWALAAEAASLAHDPAAQIPALEEIFTAAKERPLPEGLFHFSGSDLWEAYGRYARYVANQDQLLVGDDEAWFAEAQNGGARYPIRVRSIYGFLAIHGSSAESRLKAHQDLLALLSRENGGLSIARRLYLDSRHFPTPADIPDPVRWALSDAAIAEGDMSTASRLLQDLDTPPKDTDRILWQLRRAKVFVLAADYPSAESLLERLVTRSQTLDQHHIDRLMQLLFDLQTVGEHHAAYHMFSQLASHASGQFKRELLYWMADSQAALGDNIDAGRLYLHSGDLPGPDTMDPWAQTAKYKAAQVLATAGLKNDAAKIYRQLLKATEDPSRQAVLRRDLEQLWLERGSRE